MVSNRSVRAAIREPVSGSGSLGWNFFLDAWGDRVWSADHDPWEYGFDGTDTQTGTSTP